MRKREFVGIGIIGVMICFACVLFSKHSFKRGYKERDNDIKNYD